MTLYIGDDEIKAMVQSYHDGATIRQLAEIHNLSTTKVHGLLVQAGYRPRPKGRPADLKKTRAAYENAQGRALVREDFGAHEQPIKRCCQ